MRIATALAVVFSALLLAACGSQPVQAPVLERAPQAASKPAPAAKPEVLADTTYTVKRGDTMFSIALDHGLDYKDLAAWNNMQDPNRIRVGQQLRIKPPAVQQEAPVTVRPVTSAGRVETRPLGPPDANKRQAPQASAARTDSAQGMIKSEPQGRKLPYTPENLALLQRGNAASAPQAAAPLPAPAATPSAPPAPKPEPPVKTDSPKPDADVDEEDRVEWGRPAKGAVIAGFSEATNKGLDFAGAPGDPVIAAAPGRVVYSGSGLRGYGKLVIIKHNKTFLSAYAHNKEILVKEGQNVVKGQKIAEIGSTDSDKPKLHFEIRKLGKPVDPARYLPPT